MRERVMPAVGCYFNVEHIVFAGFFDAFNFKCMKCESVCERICRGKLVIKKFCEPSTRDFHIKTG